MSNLTVDYTGELTPTQGLVVTPLQAANQIMQGYVPANLVDLSTNLHFRDVVLGIILRDTTDHDTVLSTLCSALRSSASDNHIKTFSEYAAAVAYSWGENVTALSAITRNKPENASSFIWSVAQAMSKQMPGPFYQTILVSSLPLAESSYANSI